MSGLNPPPIRIPAKFEQDADLRAYFLDLHTFLRLLFVKASPDGGIEPEDGPILASQGMANAQRIEVLREAIEELAASIGPGGDSLPYIPPPPKPFNDFLPGLTIGKQQSDALPPVGGPVTHVVNHYHHSYTVEQAECLPPVTINTIAQDALPAITFITRFPQFEYVAVTSNFTTSGNMVVEAQAVLTVYLNPKPAYKEICIVKRYTAAGTVTVQGNGHLIDGGAGNSMSANYQFRILMFNGTQWIRLSY